MQKSIIALLLLTSAAAFANEAGDEQFNRTAAAGDRTRAEVKAETLRAQQEGTLRFSDYAGNATQSPQASMRMRSDVRAEAVQAARTRVVHELI
jgi:hypothetical protein